MCLGICVQDDRWSYQRNPPLPTPKPSLLSLAPPHHHQSYAVSTSPRPTPSDLTPENVRVAGHHGHPCHHPRGWHLLLSHPPHVSLHICPFHAPCNVAGPSTTWIHYPPKGKGSQPEKKKKNHHQGRWANEMSPRKEVCASSSGRKPLGPFNF